SRYRPFSSIPFLQAQGMRGIHTGASSRLTAIGSSLMAWARLPLLNARARRDARAHRDARARPIASAHGASRQPTLPGLHSPLRLRQQHEHLLIARLLEPLVPLAHTLEVPRHRGDHDRDAE